MDWLYSYTNWLLGKDSSKFASAIHKMTIFLSTVLSKSPTLLLMELIFRYEKITLLRSECRKRFKLTLIFSSYSWLVSVSLVVGHTFFNSYYIFLQKCYFTQIATKKNIFFVENEYDGIKCPITLKHSKKLLLMSKLTQRVEK